MWNEFNLAQIFGNFLLWNHLQSLFPSNKRMAVLIFSEEHQSILACQLFSFLSPFPLLHLAPLIGLLSFSFQCSWSNHQKLPGTAVVKLTWSPTSGSQGRLRKAGKRKPLVKYSFHWQNSSECCLPAIIAEKKAFSKYN